jgi:hypothetical protein
VCNELLDCKRSNMKIWVLTTDRAPFQPWNKTNHNYKPFSILQNISTRTFEYSLWTLCSCSQLFELSNFKHLCFPHSPWLCPDLQIGHRRLIQWSWLYLQGATSCMEVSRPWSMDWFVWGSCAFAPKAHSDIVVRLFFLSWISIHSLDSSD